MRQGIKERIETIRNGEVPERYKMTKTGIIPVDWAVKKLAEVSDIKTGPFGSALHQKDYVQEGTPIITVEHLGEQGVVHDNLPMVSDFDRNRLKSYILKIGDIVFSRVGSVDRNSLIRETENGWLFSGRLLRIRMTNANILPSYLSYHFHYEITKQRIRSVAVGQTMASLNTQILKDFHVSFPPTLSEQQKISKILSTWDTAIELKEKLIEEKKEFKRGLMQKLLTGQIRFFGFSDEWDEKKIIDIINYEQPNGFITKNIVNLDEALTPVLTANKSFILGSTFDDNGIYTETPVIIFDDFTINNKYVDFPFKVRSSAIKILKPKNNTINIKFVYELMQFIKFPLGDHKRYYISEYQYIKIKIPTHIEQVKIVEVSNRLDSELNLLNKELNQLKEQKKGLTQLLLTGIVRVEVN